jgi:hypothetical protein
MMSADYFLAFFLLFAASAVFLWLLGAATFYRPRDGVDLSRAMARLCVARWAPANRASLLFRLTRVSL